MNIPVTRTSPMLQVMKCAQVSRSLRMKWNATLRPAMTTRDMLKEMARFIE